MKRVIKRVVNKLVSTFGYKIEKIESVKKIYSVDKNLINHKYDVDLFQYANMSSKHIHIFQEKLNGGGYELNSFPCPVCYSEVFTLISESTEGFKWGVCKQCGLLQNFHRLRNSDINTFYESGEYQAICMADLDDKTHFDLEAQIMSRYFIEIFESISISPSEVKIMEIGCGSGGILFALKDWGVRAVKGYDIDSHRINYGKNFINELEVADALTMDPEIYKNYNYVLLSNILEHLTDPVGFLIKLSNQLKSEDVKLIIDVPNLETCYGYSNKFSKFLHIGHIWYFNSTTIERLLNKAGMKIDSIFSRKASFTIICSKSSEYIENTNNSYWSSISSINYANYINT